VKQDKHVLVDNMEEVEMSGSSPTAATSGDSCDVTAGAVGKQQDQGLRFRLKRSSKYWRSQQTVSAASKL